jgi:hypothetical protein
MAPTSGGAVKRSTPAGSSPSCAEASANETVLKRWSQFFVQRSALARQRNLSSRALQQAEAEVRFQAGDRTAYC